LSLYCPEKVSEQSAVQMRANNLDLQIATYVSTTEPQNFNALVPKSSNVERQLNRQKATQPEKEEGKGPIKKGESLATFVKTKSKPPNEENFDNGKGKQKRAGRRFTLQGWKENKYPFIDDDVGGYLMS